MKLRVYFNFKSKLFLLVERFQASIIMIIEGPDKLYCDNGSYVNALQNKHYKMLYTIKTEKHIRGMKYWLIDS